MGPGYLYWQLYFTGGDRVAFGNLLQSVPFYVNEYLRLYYTGDFFQVLNPFGLLAGIASLAMFLTQGGTYLQMRTGVDLQVRMRGITQITALVKTLTFLLAAIWVVSGIDGFTVTSVIDRAAQCNPLHKKVAHQAGVGQLPRLSGIVERAGHYRCWPVPSVSLPRWLLSI